MKAVLLFALVGLCLAAAASAASARSLSAANPCAGKKDGTVLPVSGCSPAFYQCSRGKPVTPNQRCSAGLVFNAKTSPAGCASIGAVGNTGCNCGAAYKGELKIACQVCQKVQRQGNFALYAKPWPRYVSCTTQGPFVQACNAGLKWNDKKKDCV